MNGHNNTRVYNNIRRPQNIYYDFLQSLPPIYCYLYENLPKKQNYIFKPKKTKFYMRLDT